MGRKKILCIIFAIFMLFIFSACGSEEEGDKNGNNEGNGSTVNDETEYIAVEPQGNTTVERVEWLLKDLDYVRVTPGSCTGTGVDEAVSFINSLNQSGYGISQEQVEFIIQSIKSEHHFKNNNEETFCYVEVTDEGMNELISIYGLSVEDAREKLEGYGFADSQSIEKGSIIDDKVIVTFKEKYINE